MLLRTGLSTTLHGRFWVMWSASTLSTLGDGVRQVAVPLLATTLTSDPREVAFVFGAGHLAWPLFGLVGGAVADRADRRALMWRVDLARGVLAAVFAVLLLTVDVPIAALAALTFLVGVGAAFRDNAALAVVPMVVPPGELSRANAWLFAGQNLAGTALGAPLGSVLFLVAPAMPIAVDAATFLLAALLVFTVRGTYRVAAAAPRAAVRRDIQDGLRWLLRHRQLRTLCLLASASNTVLAAAQSVLVLYTSQTLGLDDLGYGLLLAVLALGGLLGAVCASALRRFVGLPAVLLGCPLAQGAALVAAGLTRSVLVVVVAFALTGFAIAAWNVVSVSLRQSVVPAELLGRVTSVYRTAGLAAMPVGAALGGVCAAGFGLPVPLLAGGALLMSCTALSVRGLLGPGADRLAPEGAGHTADGAP